MQCNESADQRLDLLASMTMTDRPAGCIMQSGAHPIPMYALRGKMRTPPDSSSIRVVRSSVVSLTAVNDGCLSLVLEYEQRVSVSGNARVAEEVAGKT